jgi:branched-subunit amino acid aminotransferase/4-amino-4-deoxychorismate lyase
MQDIPAADRGLTLGVGLFETVLAIDGRPMLWAAHLDRLKRGCAALALPPPDRALCEARVYEELAQSGLDQGRAAVRLTWTGGSGARGLAMPDPARPRLLVTVARAATPPDSAALHTSTIRRNATSPASRMKTLNYLDNVLARAEATAAGADEALMLDHSGALACAAAANLFWLESDALFTPALGCGVLDGVIRAAALRLAPQLGLAIHEVHAPASRLADGDGAFLTNSLQGAVPIRSLDGTALKTMNASGAALMARLRAVSEGREA